MSDWKPINAPETKWSTIDAGSADAWTPVGDNANCGEWDGVAGGGDCLDWDAHLCWILDTGSWADTCYWVDLKLWNDGVPFWGEVAA